MNHPLFIVFGMSAEAARQGAQLNLPQVEGGITNGDAYAPKDSEEYDYIVEHARKHGMPVSPDTENPATRNFSEYPHLVVDNGMLVGANIPEGGVPGAKVRWLNSDTVFSAIERTGKAVQEMASKGTDMLGPKAGSSSFAQGRRRKGSPMSQIIVPEGMSKPAAAEELMRQHTAEMKEASYNRVFTGYYYKDVAVAVRKAIENTFGWLNSISTPGGFFSPDEPPMLLDVPVGVNADGSLVNDKGFFGRAAVAPWGHGSYVESFANSPFSAGVKAQARKKHEPQIEAFFSEVERVLREESIFKGKPVTIEYRDGREDEPDGIHMELFHLRTNPNIVLNSSTQGIFDVLVQADLAEAHKRIYLLTGSYGNGKTETCLTVGERAMRQGYAFFYVKTPEYLAEILVGAKRYLPAVVFLEDVDQIASGDRSGAINEILNTLDGTELKGCNVKVLFTTNHPDKLATALRRPGRIDHVIKFENPDKDAKREIIHRMLGAEPGFKDLDIDACVECLPDVEGAFIAEICKRVAQYGRTMGGLTHAIFKTTADSMRSHIELMKADVESKDKVGDALKTVFAAGGLGGNN